MPRRRPDADRRMPKKDPTQTNLLAAIALALSAGAVILPLPLGLAGILLAGWGRWRHGRTRFGDIALLAALALTAAGIAIGASL
jgi:hypothetical protein